MASNFRPRTANASQPRSVGSTATAASKTFETVIVDSQVDRSARKWITLPERLSCVPFVSPSSLPRERLCPLLIEIGAIANSRLAGIYSRYAEIWRRGKRANLNKQTANEFSRRAAGVATVALTRFIWQLYTSTGHWTRRARAICSFVFSLGGVNSRGILVNYRNGNPECALEIPARKIAV